MKLIREYYELCEGGVCHDLLTESEKREVSEGRAMYLTGLMQEAEKTNGNNRVYRRETLLREVERYKELVKSGRAMGELDHPDSNLIELKNVSHRVVDIWMEGNQVRGKIKVLTETPMGKVLKGLVEGECEVGISSRGTGTVREQNGVTLVEDDFQLICFDMVADPSTSGAFMVTEAKIPKDLENKNKGIIDNFINKFGEK